MPRPRKTKMERYSAVDPNTGEIVCTGGQKGLYHNIPNQIPAETTEQADANRAIMNMNKELLFLPQIDIMDVEQVRKRTAEYFEIYGRYGYKPTVTGYALALGIDRQTLWAIRTGNTLGGSVDYFKNIPKSVVNFIKGTYNFLETSMESYMLAGKINPVAGIFLAKNHFGYQDRQDVAITPGNSDYSEAPQDKLLTEYGIETDGSVE